MWKLIIVLFGIGGTAYGMDQHQKREAEEIRFREELERLKARVDDAEARSGRQSAQYQELAGELERLRQSRAG
jgi:hypothetical protein